MHSTQTKLSDTWRVESSKWCHLKTYFAGWFGALITYPILFFTLGFLITFVF